MENSTTTGDNHTHALHHHDFQKDVADSKLAFEAWSSQDPDKIKFAVDEKARIVKDDRKAWDEAMKEIDAEQKRVAQEKRDAAAKAELQRELEAEQAARAAAQAAPPPPPAAEAPPPPPAAEAPPPPPGEATAAIAPQGDPAAALAPPEPNTPGYNAAWHQPPVKHWDLNIFGLAHVGVNSHISLEGGINIPKIFQGEGELGGQTGGKVEIFPGFKPLHARVGAEVGINQDGLHGEGGAGANFLNLAGGDLDVSARLGKNTGADGDFRGKALIAQGQGDAGVSIDERGVGVYGGGNGSLLNVVGARGGGRATLLGPDSGIAAGVGGTVAGKRLDVGPSSDGYSDGTSIQAIHVDPGDVNAPTFFPTGNRAVDAPTTHVEPLPAQVDAPPAS